MSRIPGVDRDRVMECKGGIVIVIGVDGLDEGVDVGGANNRRFVGKGALKGCFDEEGAGEDREGVRVGVGVGAGEGVVVGTGEGVADGPGEGVADWAGEWMESGKEIERVI